MLSKETWMCALVLGKESFLSNGLVACSESETLIGVGRFDVSVVIEEVDEGSDSFRSL